MVKCQRAANASVHWQKPSLSLFLSDSQWQLSWDRQSRTGGRCCRLLERLASCSPLSLCLYVSLFTLLLCFVQVLSTNKIYQNDQKLRMLLILITSWLQLNISPLCLSLQTSVLLLSHLVGALPLMEVIFATVRWPLLIDSKALNYFHIKCCESKRMRGF